MKVRRINYSADEMLAGVSGELSAHEFGVYWMVCTLIYSSGRSIDDDAQRLAGRFKGCNQRSIRSALDRLIELGKIEQKLGKLSVKRCEKELELSANRIKTSRKNGKTGGRPRNENNDLEKPAGFAKETAPLTINHQPSTIKQENSPPTPPIAGLPAADQPSRSPKGSLCRVDAAVSAGFAEWYAAYPRRQARARAERAYRTALRIASHQQLMDGVARSAASWERERRPRDKIPYPATWLNAQQWLDEPEPESMQEASVRLAMERINAAIPAAD